MVANSMTESLKGSATSLFNVRVMECRLACAMLQAMLGIEGSEALTTLHAVQSAAGMSLDELGDALKRHLPQGGVTLDQAAAAIGAPPRQVVANLISARPSAFCLGHRPCTPSTNPPNLSP